MAVPHFHKLKIREIRNETSDSISVAFEVPPGLRDLYRFREGQFLTLRDTMDGEEVRRSYSVCCGVHEYDQQGELRVAIKRVGGGRFSNWANEQLRAGREIDVMTPDGRFFVELDPTRGRHHVGFAGGSGITPMLSLIKTTLATEPYSCFTLIYGNRNVDSIMFLETLEELKNRYMARLSLYHVLSEGFQEAELFSGLLDAARCRELLRSVVLPETIDEAFICGPAPMMDAAEKALLEAGVPAARIHVERFGTPAAPPPPVRPVAAGAPSAKVVLIIDGKERHLNVPFDGPAILDAGLAAGANLPYACKGGVCCTCRARVLEGEARMDKNYTLEPQEIAAGFVLTCQSHPVSDRLVVSYDER